MVFKFLVMRYPIQIFKCLKIRNFRVWVVLTMVRMMAFTGSEHSRGQVHFVITSAFEVTLNANQGCVSKAKEWRCLKQKLKTEKISNPFAFSSNYANIREKRPSTRSSELDDGSTTQITFLMSPNANLTSKSNKCSVPN